jgi:acetylornithine deacetylase
MTDPRWPLIRASLDRLAPRYREVLSALVAYPSVVGDETPAQRYLADVAADAGLEVELWQVDPAMLASEPRSGTADPGREPIPNLTAVLRGSGGGRSLALSGHVDVVPVGEASSWTREPFSGTVADGRLHGRGALDMKGGLVAALHAIAALRASGVSLRGDLVLESVIEGETTGAGACAARRHGPTVDAAIIPAPSGEQVHVAARGDLWAELTTTGRPAHAEGPGGTVNAVDVMLAALAALRSLPQSLAAGLDPSASAGLADPPALEVGTITGGDWPSSVPMACRAGIRFSFPIGWSVARARSALTERLAEVADRDPWLREHPPAVRWHGLQAEGWEIDPEAPVVRTLAEAVHDETRADAVTASHVGAAHARFSREAGIPAVCYGPSGGGQHGPDEWVDLASVARVTRVLARTALTWCG